MNYQQLMPTLIDDTCDAIKQSFLAFVEDSAFSKQEDLTSELVSQFTEGLQQALHLGGKTALKQLVENFECKEDVVIRAPAPASEAAERYTFKTASSKKFLSVFGEIEINRRLYYHWKGGPAFVPLDEAWDMQGRYATPEVTEALLLSASMLNAGEVSQLLAKTCPFKPSVALIQDIINQDGAALVSMLEQPELVENARPIKIPDEPIKALVASIDGANVMVREPGNKRGRPTERPSKEKNENPAAPSSCSYKNAMIGSLSYYGEPESVIDIKTQEQILIPKRIQSVYHGRMPEAKYSGFKVEFEQSIERIGEQVPESAVRILLMDGARNLWNYVEQNPLYKDYLKVVDYFHASEHLSRLSEALFGKNSEQGQQWFKKWSEKIKREDKAVAAMLRCCDPRNGIERRRNDQNRAAKM